MNATATPRPAWILPVIVLAQFAATSLWFAANAVLPDLRTVFELPANAVGLVTSAVQFGFVAGTLIFALLTLSDRFRPSTVFLVCALLGAACNTGVFVVPEGLWPLLVLRFATGFFLAGIYPVGMKIAASWYAEGLGGALGYLVGALVLGTAFPHLIEALGGDLPWRGVMAAVSGLAVAGGLAVYLFVPAGPHLPGPSPFDPRAIPDAFSDRNLRSAAFGYFGHMWELYPVLAFFPVLLVLHIEGGGASGVGVSLWSFFAIAAGAVGCMGGGMLSRRLGSARVAFVQLACSGVACVVSPWLLHAPTPVFLAFLLFWGMTVSGDSPQFSTLVAGSAPRRSVGTALTFVNSMGFAITIVSLQLVELLRHVVHPDYMMWVLVPGPVIGLLAMRRLLQPPLST